MRVLGHGGANADLRLDSLSDELSAFPANARARAALQALYRASGRSQDAAALAQH